MTRSKKRRDSSVSSTRRNTHKIARRVWEKEHGPIPEGHVIHHRDKDPFNNEIVNLECMTRFDHDSMHSKANTHAQQEARRENMKVAHAAQMEQMTPEDRTERAKKGWEGREAGTLTCQHCGEAYDTRHTGDTKYCSNACKSAARRASGVDNVTRFCLACGTAFLIDKYKKQQTCSRTCAWEQRKKEPPLG